MNVPQTGEVSRSAQIERLTKLSRAFTYASSLDAILELAVTQAAQMLSADKAILLLPDDDGVLHVSASHGVSAEVVERFSESLDESLAGRLRELLGTRLAEGFVGVPLVTKGNVIGLLAVLRGDNENVSEDDEWLLSALADQVAAPLENARLAQQLERADLLNENARLYESERAARGDAEAAREVAENAMLQANAARNQAEQALVLAQQSDRSKAAFLAAMSHDLRTPLNAIAGYVELLKMGIRGPITPEQAVDLERISTNQKHLLSIVSDVLDFARMGAGRVTYRLEDVSLDEPLHDAEAMVMPQITLKKIEYRYTAAQPPIVCRTDPDKLRQILINLLSNATKFTPDGGSITTRFEIRRDAKGAVAQIHVQDTGPGIAEDHLESIFLPFVQIGRTLSNPDEGIGLGLAISRDLARGLGGDLTVVSEPGKGSTFTVTLPLD